MFFTINSFERKVLRELLVLDMTSDETTDVLNLSNEEILQKFVSIQILKQTIDDNLIVQLEVFQTDADIYRGYYIAYTVTFSVLVNF